MKALKVLGDGIRRLSTVSARREISRLCREISAREPEFAALSDEELQARGRDLKQQAAAGTPLDDLLVPAFAAVREAAKRVLGQRPFDVQIMGGIALHQGLVVEMKTGEGKTLAATMPAFLNALGGRGVHVVTVNDYLAKRDAEWMGAVYRFLGLEVASLTGGMEVADRKRAYQADITYGVHTEFAFDYLRDNLRHSLDEIVQRDLDYVIIDEVDSVLIDEARMPIEIMTPSLETSASCYEVDRLIQQLDPDHIDLDEKQRRVQLTEDGIDRIEELLKGAGLIKEGDLYDHQNLWLVQLVSQALSAHHLHKRDRDYIVKDGDVVVIDELRGRMLSGRRLGDGLHEALEAKEGLTLRNQGTTVAQTTYQNYFRLYRRIGGMTGTASMDAQEYQQIYGLSVVDIPTNRPMIRVDGDDEVYRSSTEKLAAIVERTKKHHARRQPILIGTTSVGQSEAISAELSRHGIAHEVLNARQHEREAEIIAEAGRPGAVTVATNMAGRGTDIQLGGNLAHRVAQATAGMSDAAEIARVTETITREVAEAREAARAAGGLLIIGTERFYCRRIDDQLIGRAGRQGDPGETVFMLSLDDELIRIFGGADRLRRRLDKIGLDQGAAMFHSWLTRAIRKAQGTVEEMQVESRMRILDFDDVANDQRKIVYNLRREILAEEDFDHRLAAMRTEILAAMIARRIPPDAYAEQWDLAGLKADLLDLFNLVVPVEAWAAEEGIADEEMLQRIETCVVDLWRQRLEAFEPGERLRVTRYVVMHALDQCWLHQIASLEHLRFGVNLRSTALLIPLQEYRKEAYSFFEEMLAEVGKTVARSLSRLVPNPDPVKNPAPPPPPTEPVRVKRLQMCPCGSGLRFKECHGRVVGSEAMNSPAVADVAVHSSKA